ncbi:SHOCT domain-containing protein [Gordonia sp. NPDC003376]
MPGLLRGVARTAVIAGTATSVSNRVSRRQGRRWAQQDTQREAADQYAAQQQAAQQQAAAQQYAAAQQAAPQAAAPQQTDSRIAQLQQLADLRSQGILTDEEFTAEKQRILSS